MIYSDDDTEEKRMLEIRNTPADRCRIMAKQRAAVGRQTIPFHKIELQWLEEEDRFSELIPVLTPQEYWAMIRNLVIDLQTARRSY